MSEDEKKRVVNNIIARVATGFAFINDKYLVQQRNAGGPDAAWLRCVYILFSFHFEILLKSAFILAQSFDDKNELDNKLKKIGHNIKIIGRKIGGANLKDFGIEKISLKNGEYIIKTYDKIIYVKDFNDIRYDFIEGKIRNITANEDLIIKDSLDGAYNILEKIKYKNLKK